MHTYKIHNINIEIGLAIKEISCHYKYFIIIKITWINTFMHLHRAVIDSIQSIYQQFFNIRWQISTIHQYFDNQVSLPNIHFHTCLWMFSEYNLFCSQASNFSRLTRPAGRRPYKFSHPSQNVLALHFDGHKL
jgi:hypothetical protein